MYNGPLIDTRNADQLMKLETLHKQWTKKGVIEDDKDFEFMVAGYEALARLFTIFEPKPEISRVLMTLRNVREARRRDKPSKRKMERTRAAVGFVNSHPKGRESPSALNAFLALFHPEMDEQARAALVRKNSK